MRTHRFVAATSTFLVAVTFSATAAWGVLAHNGPHKPKATTVTPVPEGVDCIEKLSDGTIVECASLGSNDDGAGVVVQ